MTTSGCSFCAVFLCTEFTDPILAMESALGPMLVLQAWYDDAGEGSRLLDDFVVLFVKENNTMSQVKTNVKAKTTHAAQKQLSIHNTFHLRLQHH